ncbi:MAG: signal peptidase II [Nitrospirae bacterium]|nr:signal peptidase II [Nitrospirota bacterium]
MKRFLYVIFIVLFIVALDQITKYLITIYVKSFESIKLFTFLHIVSVKNTGGAFGILKEMGNSLFIMVSLVAIMFIMWLLIHSKESYFGLSFILGGAIGNLIDRLLYGWVVDFIDFSIGRFHWPAFNVADSAITIGVIMVLLSLKLHKK